jgi:hypothetical protein
MMAYAILVISMLAVPAALCAAIWTLDWRVFLIFLVTLANAGFWVAVMHETVRK